MNTLDTLIASYEAAKTALQEHKDGFLYIVETCCYGYKHRIFVNNSYELKQITDVYNGDIGLAHVYTNNPEIQAWCRDYVVTIYKPRYVYIDPAAIDFSTDLDTLFEPVFAEDPSDEDRMSEQEWKDVHGYDTIDEDNEDPDKYAMQA